MKTEFTKLIKPYRITKGKAFSLKAIDPDDTGSFSSDLKQEAADMLSAGSTRLKELQDKLYAQDRRALLLILQGMDTSGKDGTVKHVMSGVNPMGCEVTSFKAPSSEDLDHDFLWRSTKRLPERGRIGIFNRSYYEEVLVVRVHRDILLKQQLPAEYITKEIWSERFEDINNLESYLHRNGIVVCKFFLHMSADEQKRRFLERIDEPDKNWKFSLNDVRERAHWNEYMDAYEDMIRHTATKQAPWYVVPANHKWYTRMIVAAAIVETLQGLNLAYPKVNASRLKEIADSRAALVAEKRSAFKVKK